MTVNVGVYGPLVQEALVRGRSSRSIFVGVITRGRLNFEVELNSGFGSRQE